MKTAVIVIAGSGRSHDVTIEPATTPEDIFRDLGIGENFVLSKDNGAHVFGHTENIYAEIKDGEKLHAASRTDVGYRAQSMPSGESPS